jgi:hypothetical protein
MLKICKELISGIPNDANNWIGDICPAKLMRSPLERPIPEQLFVNTADSDIQRDIIDVVSEIRISCVASTTPN